MQKEIKKTIKLYDTEPYARQFTAQILCVEEIKGGWQVVLDQTLFFPEEGGQSADTGVLGCVDPDTLQEKSVEVGGQNGTAWQVTDVQIRDGVIYHMLQCVQESKSESQSVPRPGMTVHGAIDWQARFSNMQNHTGEHIISGLIHSKYGYDNVGFHLSKNVVTLDQSGYLTSEQVAEIEYEANRVVWANVPVTAEYVSPEEAKTRTYRSKIEIDGDVRLVTIGDVDVCACCAPHVARTGEIGLIKILRSEKYKGGTRMTILCGARALAEVSKRQTQIEQISHLLRAKQDEAKEAVQHLYDENAAQKERLIRLQEEKIRKIAENILGTEENVWVFTEDLDPLPHRNLVNLLVEKCEGFAGVFLDVSADKSNDNNRQTGQAAYRFIIGSRNGDCREIAKKLGETFGAKGGGKPEMVQGSVEAEQSELADFLASL